MLLHLHEWGERAAPPLVCLHGVTGHGRRFRRLAEERLAQRFRVLAPDPRGHGRSDSEPPQTLRAPTLLVHAERFGLVREDQLAAYRAALGDRLQTVAVPGGHVVLWDAYEETAATVSAF